MLNSRNVSEDSFAVVAADVSRLKFYCETCGSAGRQSRLTPAATVFQKRARRNGAIDSGIDAAASLAHVRSIMQPGFAIVRRNL